MNPKSTLILFIAAVAVVAAALMFRGKDQQLAESSAAPVREVAAGITSGSLTRIEILPPAGGTSVTLTRKDDAWYTDDTLGHKADRNMIGSLFNTIEQPLKGEVVSTNKDSHPDYDLTETSATRVKLVDSSGKATELLIGKTGPSFFTTFVRKPDSDEVINVRASLTYAFNKPEGWRDKSIFEIQPDTIVGFSGEGTSGTFELRREDGQWKMKSPEDRAASEAKVSPMTAIAGALKTGEFVDLQGTTATLADLGLDPARQRLTIFHEDRGTSPAKEVSSVLLIGAFDEEKSVHYAKRADGDTVYTLTDFQARTLAPAAADLLPPEEAAPVQEVAETTAPAEEATTATEAAPAVADGVSTESDAAAPAVEDEGLTESEAAAPAPEEDLTTAPDEQTTAALEPDAPEVVSLDATPTAAPTAEAPNPAAASTAQVNLEKSDGGEVAGTGVTGAGRPTIVVGSDATTERAPLSVAPARGGFVSGPAAAGRAETLSVQPSEASERLEVAMDRAPEADSAATETLTVDRVEAPRSVEVSVDGAVPLNPARAETLRVQQAEPSDKVEVSVDGAARLNPARAETLKVQQAEAPGKVEVSVDGSAPARPATTDAVSTVTISETQ